VKVPHPFDGFADGADAVALHDLHVIDVEQQLEAGLLTISHSATPQSLWSH
jgi:hypothetical protein